MPIMGQWRGVTAHKTSHEFGGADELYEEKELKPYFLVKKRHTGELFVRKETGYRSYNWADDGEAINYALSELPADRQAPVLVELCGTLFTITRKLIVYSNTILDMKGANLKQNGLLLNDSMIQNVNYGAAGDLYNFVLRNGYLWGHRTAAGRTAGSNIDLDAETTPSPSPNLFAKHFIRIENVESWEAKNHNFFLRFDTRNDLAGRIMNIAGTRAGGRGLYMRGCNDWTIVNAHHIGGAMESAQANHGTYIYGGGLIKILGGYFSGGFETYFGNKIAFIGCQFDQTCDAADKHVFRWRGTSRSQMIGCVLRYLSGSTDNTYDGVNMVTANATAPSYNQFVGNIFEKEGTPDFKYGIQEVNGDYNVFGFLTDYASCQTAMLRKLGANSKYVADSMIGTVVVV